MSTSSRLSCIRTNCDISSGDIFSVGDTNNLLRTRAHTTLSKASHIIEKERHDCWFNHGFNGTLFNATSSESKAILQGGIATSMAGGSWLGAMVSGVISDNFGPRKLIIAAGCFWFVEH